MSYTPDDALTEQSLLDALVRLKTHPTRTLRPMAVVTRRYVPSVGSHLVVRLPGEMMRCSVERIVDDNRVIIEISGVPMSRSHQYRKGDTTGARRKVEFGKDVWEALDDRDFIANRSPTEPVPPPEPEPPVVKKVAPKVKPKAKKGRAK